MVWEFKTHELPAHLRRMRNTPERLFIRASKPDTFMDLMRRPRVAVIGTRCVTPYGRQTTQKLSGELAAKGVVIISGLALGIDSIAHRAALDSGGLTMAVLPGTVEEIYPRSHYGLAIDMIESGGVLLSEQPTNMPPLKQHFIARNRIVAGLADALLVVEAADNSGTVHTTNFAKDQGIAIFAVPGNIDSPMSDGTNKLIKDGAKLVTSAGDILNALNLASPLQDSTATSMQRSIGANSNEQILLNLLESGVYDGNELLAQSQLDAQTFNHHMTMLEIGAKIRSLGSNQWGIA